LTVASTTQPKTTTLANPIDAKAASLEREISSAATAGCMSAAAQRDDGAVVLAPNLKGSATGKVVGIARAITGTAWSGPRFFGVRPYLSGSRDGFLAAKCCTKRVEQIRSCLSCN
jgi:hypothetical protein